MKIKLDSNNRVVESITDGYEYGDGWITIRNEELPPDFFVFPSAFELKDKKLVKWQSIEQAFAEDRRRIERGRPVLLQTQYISREDFNLLDAQDDHTLYYILEEDGTTTMLKGENR